MKPEPTRFFSKVAGAAVVFSDGNRILFLHGFLDVNAEKFPGNFHLGNKNADPEILKKNGRSRWEVYYEELMDIITHGNPMIFTQATVKQTQDLPRVDTYKLGKSEAEIAAQDAILSRTAGGNIRITGDQNAGTPTSNPTDVNASTVDHQLQTALLAAKVPAIGPGMGNSAVEKARAEAAMRTMAAASKP